MHTPRWIIPTALAALLLAPAAPRAMADYGDPQGDTFNSGSGYAFDIRSVKATYTLNGSVTNTTFVVDFWNDIRPTHDFGAINSLFGSIDIDADRDASTGETARANEATSVVTPSGLAALSLGVEYYVDFFDDAITPGTVYLRNASDDAEVAAGSIAFESRRVTVSVPIPGVAGTPRGAVNYAMVAANGVLPTDRGPGGMPGDSSTIALTSQLQPVPEPTALALMGLGTLGLVALGVRRRRSSSIAVVE